MKAGVVSDTRGNLSGLLAAVEHMREEGVTKIFHLGNNYIDVQNYINMRRQILKGKRDYDDTDFLSDFSDFLMKQQGNVRSSKDLDEVQWLRKNIIQVPAEQDPQFELDNIKKCEFDMLGGKFVAVTHNLKSLGKEDIASANIVLYGLTHKYQADVMQNRFFLNPGHLHKDEHEGRPPTYAIVTLGEGETIFTVYNLKRESVYEKRLQSTKKRKFKTV